MTDGPHLDSFSAFVLVMTHVGTQRDVMRKALQVHPVKNKIPIVNSKQV